jgi:hypothetical protein
VSDPTAGALEGGGLAGADAARRARSGLRMDLGALDAPGAARAIEGGDGGIARVAMCGSGRWLGRSRGAAASVARRFRSKARRMRGERVRK